MSNTVEKDTASEPNDHQMTKVSQIRASHLNPNRHIRSLASRIISLRGTSCEHKTIGVTSCSSGEGSSTVASNLSVAINEAIEGEVLLVDTVRRVRGTSRRNARLGWSDFVFGDAELCDIVMPTDVPKLSVIGFGMLGQSGTGTYNREKLINIMQFLKERFEFIVFDLPSAQDPSDCLPIAGAVDGVLMVLKSGHVNSADAARFKHELNMQDANLIGAVLNQTESYIPKILRSILRVRD